MVHDHGTGFCFGAKDLRAVAVRRQAVDIKGGESVVASVGGGELCIGDLCVQSGVEGGREVLLGGGISALSGRVRDVVPEVAIQRHTAEGVASCVFDVHSCAVCSKHSLGSHL